MRVNKTIYFIAIASVSAMLASATTFRSAFAEAGSTGGTLGQTDKSVSGERQKQTLPENRLRHKGYHAIQGPPSQTGGSTRSPAKSKTFQNPTIRGVRVNWCMTNTMVGCGETAATTWCRSQGLSHATSFKWTTVSPAYLQGDRDICNGFCGGFTEITCE